jgi:hypothetical protein
MISIEALVRILVKKGLVIPPKTLEEVRQVKLE